MADLQTITVEILRPGPAHNQLLSPLTNYIALCDDRGAVTLQLPFEHREMTRQREALSYAVPRSLREAQLMQTGDAVGNHVLGAISTLNAALAQTQYGKAGLIHLRLILSASELAMLPFELATAPQGFPGEAKPLLIQSIAPITLTREVRGATVSRASWSRQPKILVIAASPPGFEPVPLRAHLLALRRAVDHWVPTERDGGVRKIITVLPRANIESIREACAKDDYTHIHILAHGTKPEGGGGFGLALFDRRGEKADVIGGNRLASTLRTHRRDGQGFASPNFVTFCTCDSSNVSSVVFPGASMAHDLHEAGIPWVVASQFPLSMVGSTLLTEHLYAGLLRGDDPRAVLHHLRLCLRAECSGTHDWASVVTYAAVPHDFDEQVRDGRQQQSQRAIDVAFSRVDQLMEAPKVQRGRAETTQVHEQVREILSHLDEQLALLQRSVPAGDGPSQRGWQVGINSRQGSVEKRRAYVLYQQEAHEREKRPAARDDQGQPRPWAAAVRRARRHYFKAAKMELNKHWPLTQYISLLCILGEMVPKDYWIVARIGAELELDHVDRETRGWAYASLMELHLLALLWDERADPDKSLEAARDLMRVTEESPFHVQSTRRNLERYLDWGEPSQNRRFLDTVKQLLQTLSQEP